MSIRFEVTGMDALVGAMQRAARAAAAQAELLSSVGEVVRTDVLEHFEVGQGPDGPWPESERVRRKGGKTLIDKGTLRGGVGVETDGQSTVLVGTNEIYGRIHQLGGKAGRGHAATIPARPYLWLSHAARDEIKALCADHVASAITGNRGQAR